MIRLLVGLGNPGAEYDDTRHNAGFWWVDAVAAKLGVALRPERSYFGLLARADVQGRPLWLLEPMTYMNLSGKSVAALARFHKIAPQEIFVAHDELDLPPGEAKIKQGGSHAGHNGLKDIQAQLGSADFWRLRIGIGHPGDRDEVIHHVLRRPPSDERAKIDAAIASSIDTLDAIVAGDLDAAIRAVHARPARPKPPRREAAP